MSRFALVLSLALALVVVLTGPAFADLTITRAELDDDRLRIRGSGAVPNATITVDGVGLGTADDAGDFRVEQQPFSSATCEVAVSDGSESVAVTLDGCTPGGEEGGEEGPTGASFAGLRHLTGQPNSFAEAVSGDGETVVGRSGDRAFRWTAATGLEDFGAVVGVDTVTARAISFDGSWVVGGLTAVPSTAKGYRWSAATGLQELPMGSAIDVSDDGSVVVGPGVRWENGEVVTVGDGTTSHLVHGASRDGDVVVGWFAPDGDRRAFRWSEAGGSENLGTLKGAERGFFRGESIAEDANSDGTVVVGQARDKDDLWRAFRWTPQGGMEDLRTLRNGAMSAAFAVSADGSVVVGQSLTTSALGTERAFRWSTDTTKMQDIQEELLDRGVTEVQGWFLRSAVDVSADGTVIVGFGRNPDREFEAWRAVLPR